MSASRPSVPAAIERALLEEAGYRCAVPTCRATGPFDMEHIEDWAKVKEHKFENMILLCKNCHGRVTAREITKASVRAYKRNLAILNGRYSIYELRMIETFWDFEKKRVVAPGMLIHTVKDERPGMPDDALQITHYGYTISGTDFLHLKGLRDDGLVSVQIFPNNSELFLVIPTDQGKKFIRDYFSGATIEQS
jgi:HNH endonuclease